MAVKERNDNPHKLIGECFFCFFSIGQCIKVAQLGEMGFDVIAMGFVGCVPERQY